MMKLLAKIAAKYAKASTSECYLFFFHEAKMPAALLK